MPDSNPVIRIYYDKEEVDAWVAIKADKVSGDVLDHVVSLDSTGNIKDSGIHKDSIFLGYWADGGTFT